MFGTIRYCFSSFNIDKESTITTTEVQNIPLPRVSSGVIKQVASDGSSSLLPIQK
jgi:hypothetical protein